MFNRKALAFQTQLADALALAFIALAAKLRNQNAALASTVVELHETRDQLAFYKESNFQGWHEHGKIENVSRSVSLAYERANSERKVALEQVESLKTALAVAEYDKGELSANIAEIDGLYTQLEHNRDNALAHVQRLEEIMKDGDERRDALDKRNHELANELAAALAGVDEANEKLFAAESSRDAVTGNWTSTRARVLHLEEIIEQGKSASAKQASTIKELTAQLADAITDRNNARERAAANLAQLQECRDKLAASEDFRKRLAEALVKSRKHGITKSADAIEQGAKEIAAILRAKSKKPLRHRLQEFINRAGELVIAHRAAAKF